MRMKKPKKRTEKINMENKSIMEEDEANVKRQRLKFGERK